MQYLKEAEAIIDMVELDLSLRSELIKRGELFNGYHAEMKKLQVANAAKLEKIISDIGYPTAERVGKEASAAAWMIIQHAISCPPFMRKCLKLLKEAVNQGLGDPVELAYLTDRIATFEDRPQLYGTQFDWDQQGALSPKPYDDLTEVNRRREKIGLNSLEEQIGIMRCRASQERETAPQDLSERSASYNAWRRRVGWIV